MPTRLRKLIGGVAILAFLAFYAVSAAALFERLPDQQWLKLAFVAVVGLGWGLPLIPLIRWMNQGR